MAAGDLELHVIDVGQGDGILVVSPDGFTMLIDRGEESVAGTVEAYLISLGVTELDYTLVTHMHADHLGATDAVLAAHPEVVACFDNGGTCTTTESDEHAAAAGARRTRLSSGGTIDLGPSMTAQVLHGWQCTSDENNNSLVALFDFGGDSIISGGDCGSACESSLSLGDVDVYKVHHHGSSGSSTRAFLDRILPEDAPISAGASNPYGHPAQETLDRLTGVGATIWRTDLDGDIEVISTGAGYTVNGVGECVGSETRQCGTTDVGACEYGIETCAGGTWGACVGAVEPTTEVCDSAVDDDCDGWTDTDDTDCSSPSAEVVLAQVYYDTAGDDAVLLTGWAITDNYASWTFPAGTTIAAGDYLTVAANTAGLVALFGIEPDVDGLSLALGNSGDYLTLSDELGAEVEFVALETAVSGWSIAAGTGSSIERADPGVDSDTVSGWSVATPAAPRGGVESICGNGTCDAGEDCSTCAADCPGKSHPVRGYCCGNGVCESTGETAANCPIDCG